MSTRLDIAVPDCVDDNPEGWQSNCPILAANGALYYFYSNNNNTDLYYIKSTDFGGTWTAPILVQAEVFLVFSTWYDRWTVATSGDLIHIACFGQTGDDVFYYNLDTSTDTLSSQVIVFNGISAAVGSNTSLSITKAMKGRVMKV